MNDSLDKTQVAQPEQDGAGTATLEAKQNNSPATVGERYNPAEEILVSGKPVLRFLLLDSGEIIAEHPQWDHVAKLSKKGHPIKYARELVRRANAYPRLVCELRRAFHQMAAEIGLPPEECVGGNFKPIRECFAELGEELGEDA